MFLGMSTQAGVHELREIIWLFCDQFFTAFQVNQYLYIVIDEMVTNTVIIVEQPEKHPEDQYY